MHDFELQPIGIEPEPVELSDTESQSNRLEKIFIIGIMAIPVLCIVFGFLLYYSNVSESLDEPIIGPLPAGWFLDRDAEQYANLFDLPGSQLDMGFLGCNKGFSNHIQIYYNDVFLFGAGHENDAEWLRLQAIDKSVFQWEESGNMEVGGSIAGFTKESRSADYETQIEMQMCFVKEETFFNIYTSFQKRNESEVLEIINSIRFSEQTDETEVTVAPEEVAIEDVVTMFMTELTSADIEDLAKYFVLEDGKMPEDMIELCEKFIGDTEIEISNISVEIIWATDSETALRVTYDRKTEVIGRVISVSAEDTFLFEKHDHEWLISRWGNVPQSPPNTSVPNQTPTPDPTLTAAPSPSPIGKVLLSDDFSKESNTWPVYSDRYGIAYYKDEALLLKHRGHFIKPEFCVVHRELTDFIMELDAAMIEGNDSSWIAVALRTDYWGNGYHFLLNNRGQYAIDLRHRSNDMEYLAEPNHSEYISTGYGVKNRLRIECDGGEFRFLVNGYLLAEIQDETIQSGAFGLGVITAPGSGSAEVMFDDFQLATLPGADIPEEWK